MALGFNLEKRDVIDNIHGVDVYRFNLALHHALLSNDSAVVRRFFQQEAAKLGCNDIFKWHEIERSFFFNARTYNAFVYAGLTPWIVESIVRLVASSGFQVNSVLLGNGEFAEAKKKDTDDYINRVVKEIELQDKFERGVYLESGLGDFAYRISYDKNLSDKPIIDVIEAQFLEVKFKRGILKEITIKETSDEIQLGNAQFKHRIEIHEIYKKENGKVVVEYKFFLGENEITDKNPGLYAACKKHWNIDKIKVILPFKDFPIVYKRNNKKSELYKQERGVPDIQGIDTIEDALSESISNLVETIRKAAPKTFVDEEILPVSIDGQTDHFSAFDHEYLLVKGGNFDPSKLLQTIQAKIDYQSHVETAKYLISLAINKAGLSPTTLGVTGLESINSSQESQDAREKPSLRTRSEKLKGWGETLTEVLDKYFQYLAYVKGEPIESYKDMFNISFNEYINPSTENVVDVIAKAVAGQVYSVETGVEKTFIHEGKDYTLEDIIIESARIRGISPQQEMEMLGLVEDNPEQPEEPKEDGSQDLENTEGDEPSVFHNQNKSTETLNEEEQDGRSPNNTDE